MINGLDIYYSKNIGRGLKPIANKKTASGLKPISKKNSFWIKTNFKRRFM